VQLNQAEIIQQNQQNYLISGAVDFSTVPDLMQRISDLFKSYKKSAPAASAGAETGITMDLSKITVCNSAGLAMILEMVRQAGDHNIKLHFRNWPVSLLSIAKAYGVDDEIRDFI
jgi:ABC-type transporter Mla MlaB component